MMRVADIRARFQELTPDETGMLEIVNASFIADEPAIFGTVNQDYVEREHRWYMSMSRSIHDMIPPIPQIWQSIASKNGRINSNYGWCVFSKENYSQYQKAVQTLERDRYSRQAVMIYTRPTMHEDARVDGMKDFLCTYAVQLLIRGNALHYLVNMRSSDAVYGYKNDRAFHEYVWKEALDDLQHMGYPALELGSMYWNAGSLHIYPRHHHLVKGD